MFTGIVAALGTVGEGVENATGHRIHIRDDRVFSDMEVADAVGVNGVCLTAPEVAAGEIAVDAVQESLDRSNLGDLVSEGRGDLERPLPATSSFEGHIVRGHVGGVGVVTSIDSEDDARRVRVEVAGDLSPYVVEKASATVDGVSPTVTAIAGDEPRWFEIVLIPHTLEATVLERRGWGTE